MALYQSQTKKGFLNGSKGNVTFAPFECARDVDELKRAFVIELTDEETGKKHSIALYGKEVLELHGSIDRYIMDLCGVNDNQKVSNPQSNDRIN